MRNLCFLFVFMGIFLVSQGAQAITLVPGQSQAKAGLALAPNSVKNLWQNFLLGLQGKPIPRTADLKVLVKDGSSGQAIAGATVLVGAEEGIPFAGNKINTDSEGYAYFNSAYLRTVPVITITAQKEGFGTLTIAEVKANSAEIKLQANPSENDFAFLQGKILGWPSGYNRKTLEMGLFLPALRPETLLNFDVQQIISSYKVDIDVYGTRHVPGNLVLPPQDKSYGIFPVHLEKPEFIMPLQKGISTHMSGTIGIVNIGDAIDYIKKKDFLGVLNIASLTHTNWTNRITVTNGDQFNITATNELTAKAITSNFQSVPAGLDAISISAVDPENDRGDFVPMDVKSLKSEDMQAGRGQIKLAKLAQESPNESYYVFSALLDRNQIAPPGSSHEGMPTKRAVTASLKKVQKLSSGNSVENSAFLNLITSGNVSADHRNYDFSSPNNEAKGLLADMILITIYSEKVNAQTQGKTRKVIWTAYLPGNIAQLALPKINNDPILPPPDTAKEEKFYWEIVAVKNTANSVDATANSIDSERSISNLEYVSSAVEPL